MTYYRLNKRAAAEARAVFDRRRCMWNAMDKIARSRRCAGRSGHAYVHDDLGSIEMTGVMFPEGKEPDRSQWKAINADRGYAPKKLRANKELLSDMQAAGGDYMQGFAEMIGLEPCFEFIGMHLFRGDFGLKLGGDGHAYLIVSKHEKRTPKNCRRVSDLVYEKATAKEAP